MLSAFTAVRSHVAYVRLGCERPGSNEVQGLLLPNTCDVDAFQSRRSGRAPVGCGERPRAVQAFASGFNNFHESFQRTLESLRRKDHDRGRTLPVGNDFRRTLDQHVKTRGVYETSRVSIQGLLYSGCGSRHRQVLPVGSSGWLFFRGSSCHLLFNFGRPCESPYRNDVDDGQGGPNWNTILLRSLLGNREGRGYVGVGNDVRHQRFFR